MLARALLVLGGTIAGTAAAWAISNASASADPIDTIELPDVPSVTSHVIHGDGAGSGDRLTGDGLTKKLPKTTAELGSSVVRAVEPELTKTSEGLRDAVRLPHSPSTPSKPATRGGLGKIVASMHGALDTVDHKVGTDVTAQLAPITEPILGEPPAGRHDTAGAGNGSDIPATAASHQPGSEPGTGDDSRSPRPVRRTDETVPHLPAGGLRSVPDNPVPDNPVPDYPVRDYPGAPPTVPVNSGSTSHDGGSSSSHTSVAGAHSDVPVLADPALLASLLPAAHRVELHLVEAPGSTPD